MDRVPDPIYGLVEVPQYPWLTDTYLQNQLDRLRQLNQLGFASLVFPGAVHSRWQHHLGMHHLAQRLPTQVLNNKDREALKILALVGGIGHLPGGYPTEKAVLRAAGAVPSVRDQLEELLAPVQDRVNQYGQKSGNPPLEWSDMLTADDYQSLHAWLTAYKLSRLSVDGLGHRDRLLYHRVYRDSPINRMYRFLSRVDYVQRDAYYVGVARIHLHPENFVLGEATVPSELAELVTRQLADYLRHYLYWDERLFVIEELFSREVFANMADGALQLIDLLDSTDKTLQDKLGSSEFKCDFRVVSRIEAQSSHHFLGVAEPTPSKCVDLAEGLCINKTVLVAYDRVQRVTASCDVFTILCRREQLEGWGLLRCASELARWAEDRVSPATIGRFLRQTVGEALGCQIAVKRDRAEACAQYLESKGWPLGLDHMPDGNVHPFVLIPMTRWILEQWKLPEARSPELWELLSIVYAFLLRIERGTRIILPWALLVHDRRENEVDALVIDPGEHQEVALTLIEASSSDSPAKAAEDKEKCDCLATFFQQYIPKLQVNTVLVNLETIDIEVLPRVNNLIASAVAEFPYVQKLVESGDYTEKLQNWLNMLRLRLADHWLERGESTPSERLSAEKGRRKRSSRLET